MVELNLDFLKDKKAVGWIFPNGEVVKVDLYDHFDYFVRNSTLKEKYDLGYLYDEIFKFEDFMAEEQESFVSNFDEDDHIEWHIYEIHEDDQRIEFFNKMKKYLSSIDIHRIGRYNSKIEIDNEKELTTEQKKVIKDMQIIIDS